MPNSQSQTPFQRYRWLPSVILVPPIAAILFLGGFYLAWGLDHLLCK